MAQVGSSVLVAQRLGDTTPFRNRPPESDESRNIDVKPLPAQVASAAAEANAPVLLRCRCFVVLSRCSDVVTPAESRDC